MYLYIEQNFIDRLNSFAWEFCISLFHQQSMPVLLPQPNQTGAQMSCQPPQLFVDFHSGSHLERCIASLLLCSAESHLDEGRVHSRYRCMLTH